MGGPIVEAACWVHAWRKFFDLAPLTNAPIAIEAVERIDALFAIERENKGMTRLRRVCGRNERSRSLVAELKTWLGAPSYFQKTRPPTRSTTTSALDGSHHSLTAVRARPTHGQDEGGPAVSRSENAEANPARRDVIAPCEYLECKSIKKSMSRETMTK